MAGFEPATLIAIARVTAKFPKNNRNSDTADDWFGVRDKETIPTQIL
ncbi:MULTISPECIES: hypothetical protein [unclassified Microcoleus]